MSRILLHCRQQGNDFFIPADKVQTISSHPELTPFPSLKDAPVEGICPLEGEAPPVFDSSLFIDSLGKNSDEPNAVVFVELSEGIVGLGVDEIVGNRKTEKDEEEGEILAIELIEEKVLSCVKKLREKFRMEKI